MLKYHTIALLLGFLLEFFLGSPRWIPQPMQWIKKMSSRIEKRFLGDHAEQRERNEKKECSQGMWMVVIVLGVIFVMASLLLFVAYYIHIYLGTAVETVMTYQVLTTKSMKVESMKVYWCLRKGNIEDARKSVSRLVKRDTEGLNEEDTAKAAIEFIAENTTDGVVAPLLYTAIGGPVLGFLYRAVSIMDLMGRYEDDRNLYFGRAAKLHDMLSYIPSRISVFLLLGAVFLEKDYSSAKDAFRIYRRDGQKLSGPDAAQTETVYAGALGIQLGGDVSYLGVPVKRVKIGDMLRPTEHADIREVNRLMYTAACTMEFLCIAIIQLFL